LPHPAGFEAKPVTILATPRCAWCGWDLGDPGPSQPSALPRTLSRARKITVMTVIAGQVKHKNKRRTNVAVISNPVMGAGTPLGYPHSCIVCAALFTAATGVAWRYGGTLRHQTSPLRVARATKTPHMTHSTPGTPGWYQMVPTGYPDAWTHRCVVGHCQSLQGADVASHDPNQARCKSQGHERPHI